MYRKVHNTSFFVEVMMMKILSAYSTAGLTLYFSGELDHNSAGYVMTEVVESIENYLPRDVVLDFGEMTFMDSSGLAVILRAHRMLSASGGRLRIENPQRQPLRVLDASGIERLIPIITKGEVMT